MITICNCLRCGHEWGSRSKQPKRCAGCGAPNWWLRSGVLARSRPFKYPVNTLGVGEAIHFDIDGLNVSSMVQAVHAYGVRSGKVFDIQNKVRFFNVKRIE